MRRVLLTPLAFLTALTAAAAQAPPVDEELAKANQFVVVGTVLTDDGKTPLAGVEVTASAGIGTLFKTGATTTGKDGRFRLVFTAGIELDGGTPFGVAIVHARKPGWHGGTYGSPAEFRLSDEPLDSGDVPARTTNLVPGVESELEFRMQPAASLAVRVIDGAGQPMANARVLLTGERLPPGASVIADRRSGADGTFAVEDVPRNAYRLVLVPDGTDADDRDELEIGSIRFRDAAEYDAVVTVHEWSAGATHVSLKVARGRDRQLE